MVKYTSEPSSSKCFGVYCIRNLKTGHVYVGSTVQLFTTRWNTHRSELRHQRHHNPHLQRAWNRDGESAFVFEILEVCSDKNTVSEREQFYLEQVDTDLRYNISSDVSRPTLGLKMSDESRKRMSETRKGKKRSREFCENQSKRRKGVPQPPETIAKMRLSRYNKTGDYIPAKVKQAARELKKALGLPRFSEEGRRRSIEAVRAAREKRKAEGRDKPTAETLAKQSAARKKHWEEKGIGVETKKKLSDAQKRNWEKKKASGVYHPKETTPETRSKISAAQKAAHARKRAAGTNHLSEEDKKRKSQALKAYWAKKKSEEE